MKRIVIGIGNPVRGDDGVGAEVVRRLGSGQVASNPFEMIELWEGWDEVVVVDAARSGASPGTIHRFDLVSDALPSEVLATSTHSVGVAGVVELARAIGRLPNSLVVYGIEAGDVSIGVGLAPEVEEAVGRVVAELQDA